MIIQQIFILIDRKITCSHFDIRFILVFMQKLLKHVDFLLILCFHIMLNAIFYVFDWQNIAIKHIKFDFEKLETFSKCSEMF